MPDYTLQPALVLVTGMTGSGKTTFVVRLVLNSPEAACVFVFDWNDRFAARVPGASVCYTAAQLEAALVTRLVIFNPARMFPGAAFDTKVGKEALRFFASWVRAASKRGPGKKLFCCAEVWNFCTEDSIPPELAMLAQDGRQDHVALVLDTQRPERLNPSLVGACTELICFRLDEKNALRAVREMRADADAVQSLPLGEFLAYNRLASPDDPARVLRGKVF